MKIQYIFKFQNYLAPMDDHNISSSDDTMASNSSKEVMLIEINIILIHLEKVHFHEQLDLIIHTK